MQEIFDSPVKNPKRFSVDFSRASFFAVLSRPALRAIKRMLGTDMSIHKALAVLFFDCPALCVPSFYGVRSGRFGLTRRGGIARILV